MACWTASGGVRGEAAPLRFSESSPPRSHRCRLGFTARNLMQALRGHPMNRLRSTAAVLLGVLCIAKRLYGVIMTYATRTVRSRSSRPEWRTAWSPGGRMVANRSPSRS
jgi:hypothetical protein